jgi:uncharacterized membrane protein
VSVSATPTVLHFDGSVLESTVSVASQYTDAAFEASLRIDGPAGWTIEPESRPVALGPGEHTAFPLSVTPPSDAEPGMYFVRVQLPVGGDTIEDVVSVLIAAGEADELLPPPPGHEIDHHTQTRGTESSSGRPTGLEITSISESVSAVPGGTARLAVRLENRTRGRIDGEAMPVSPWGTWSFIGPYASGFGVEAGSTAEVAFDLDVPIDAEPGHWWVMVKLMWFGRVQYSATLPMVVEKP